MSKTGAIVFFAIFLLFTLPAESQKNFIQTNISRPLTRCRKYQPETAGDYQFASDNVKDIIYLVNSNKLLALNSFNDDKIWESAVGGKVLNITVDETGKNGNVFLLIKSLNEKIPNNYFIRSISSHTGITNWQQTINFNENKDGQQHTGQFYLSIINEKVIGINENAEMSAFDHTTGNLLWSKPATGKLSARPVISFQQIITAGPDGKISITSEDGKVESQFVVKTNPTSVLLFEDRMIIWGDSMGIVGSFDLINKKYSWKRRFGGEITNILPTPTGILFTSSDNFIYLVSGRDGKLQWKKRLSGRLSAAPLISGNFGIFNSLSDPTVNIVELATGKIVNQINLGEENYLLGQAFASDDLLVLPTREGLFTFKPADLPCENDGSQKESGSRERLPD